jgi:glyoxylase-like metal-dependent hydrolase (beta-lactamase superfamily II)
MQIHHFYDADTSTLTYVVFDEASLDAVIIDPVLDFDPPSGKVDDTSAKKVLSYVKEQGLKVVYILETHAHADHLSSSQLLKKYFPDAKVAISGRIKLVQESFKSILNLPHLSVDGSQFDFLFEDEIPFQAGSITILPMATPGHTPACSSFVIANNVFTGDALFMPDYGTGRCDFPQGSARNLFHSISRLYQLPDETIVYVGHDYPVNARELRFQTTIGESKTSNIQLKASTSEADYIAYREGRDKTLKAPRLLFPSLQVNIAAGRLPEAEANGKSYLKIPLTLTFQMD